MNELIRFLHEVGHLKNVPRAGWTIMGIAAPESVAEHSFRTAVIGYVLAHLEKADVAKTVLMCLFHDVHEARLTDLHRLARKYVDWETAEGRAIRHMLSRLPVALAENLAGLLTEFQGIESLEARIAKDADRLEFILQALEYQARGCSDVKAWIEENRQQLRTAAAQKLAHNCLETDGHCWWSGLERTEREVGQ
jgi:putative hydrolase of HD superfamily